MAGGIGGFISGIFGSENEERAKGYEVNSNAYQYGGRPGAAQETADRYRGRADEYNATMGQATRDAGAMYQQGAQDRANAGQARGMQQEAANLMRARATGQAPSIAQMQADRQMQQAAASQASAAASARGPGGLALAQQNAASNTANAQQQIGGQAQVAAAQERLAAEQAYAAQAGAMRGQDYQGQGLSFQGAAQQQQFAQGLGQLGLGYTQAEMGVNQAQLGAQQNEQAQRSANALGAQGINAGVGGQNAAMNQQNALGAVGLVTNAAGALTKSDARAKNIGPGDIVAKSMKKPKAGEDKPQTARERIGAGLAEAGADFKAMGRSVDTRYHGGGGYVPPQLIAVSDINAKVMSPSAYALAGGGLDVGATAQLMSDQVAGNYRANPTAGVSGGPAQAAVMTSDMLGKMPSDMLGKVPSDERSKVLGLDNPNLRVGDDGRGYIAEERPQELDAGQRLAAQRAQRGPGDMVAASFKSKGGSKPKKPDDLEARAREMLAQFQVQRDAQMSAGPAVRPDGSTMLSDDRTKLAAAWDQGYQAATGDAGKLAQMPADKLKAASEKRGIARIVRDAKAAAWDEGAGNRPGNQAARSLASAPYTYKPGMTPPEQAPGEPNYGPMAQNMAADPVASTAIVKQPDGMLAIDIPKYTKVLGAAAADNQAQDDEQERRLALLERRAKR